MSTAESTDEPGLDADATSEARAAENDVPRWSKAVVASLAAGVVMGIPMQFMMGIMPTVGALYGFEGVGAGWVAHLFHSAVFGLIYAGMVAVGPLDEYASVPSTGVGVGVAYGVAVWLFGAVIAMPLWLEAAGMPNPGVPNLNPMSFVGHVVFGALLGGALPLVGTVADRLRVDDGPTWAAGAVTGVVAGVGMGVILHLVMDLMPMVAALYGLEGAALGWVAHLFHSVVFAFVFAGVTSLPRLDGLGVFPTSVPVGVAYGVAVWVFGSVYAMPLWLSTIGMNAPATPNIAPISLLAHVFFGALLGVAYPALLRALR